MKLHICGEGDITLVESATAGIYRQVVGGEVVTRLRYRRNPAKETAWQYGLTDVGPWHEFYTSMVYEISDT